MYHLTDSPFTHVMITKFPCIHLFLVQTLINYDTDIGITQELTIKNNMLVIHDVFSF